MTIARDILDYVRGLYDGGHGETQSEISARLHISQAHVARILAGKVKMEEVKLGTVMQMFPRAVIYLNGEPPRASVPSVPPEVLQAVISSSRPPEEKAAIIRALYSPPDSSELVARNEAKNDKTSQA